MKLTQNHSNGGDIKSGMKLRVTQKTSIRKVVVAASIVGVLAVSFIYLNFFNSDTTHAEIANPTYRATYTTTDVSVPARLLVKPDAQARTMMNSDYKNDTAFVAKKRGRGQTIAADQYIVD